MRRTLSVLAGSLLLTACSTEDTATPGDGASADPPTYYGSAKAIVDTKCVSCHQPDAIGPFSLTTYDDLQAFAAPVKASIDNDTMPPWQPDDACNDYVRNIDLTADEKATLLAWLDAGAPEGDPADEPATEPVDARAFEPDLSLPLPEAYTPTKEPDDYRCQLIEWPAEQTTYVTGLRVEPDQAAIVHHVIAFVAGPDQVEQYRAYDAAEEGPGYTCYGGPTGGEGGGLGDLEPAELMAALSEAGLTLADLQSGLSDAQIAALMTALGIDGGSFASLGSWVPGTPPSLYPEGTGIRMEPGSLIVAQVHYNTLSADPVADRSVIEVITADAVEREATMLGMLDVGWVSHGLLGEAMEIPAGDPEVTHATEAAFDSMLVARARQSLGLAADAPLVLHGANHHMHELGTSIRSEIRRADGSVDCVLDIPDWDFAWQGSYFLEQPMTLRPGDAMWMGCQWDNSAANQPVIDGEVRQPADVSWGEGTTDEMCLGGYFVTGE